MSKATLAEYARFQKLAADERRAIFDIAANRLGIAGTNVEKDYWVCYTLAALMKAKPSKPKRFFKGGTSLSKGYQLIERFSEDIDIVLARSGLFQIDAQLRGKPDPFDPAAERPRSRQLALLNFLHGSLEGFARFFSQP
jgi:hypothetical protein